MEKVLIIRFGALGDIAISIPPVFCVARAYPNTHFIYLSDQRFEALFKEAPANLEFIGMNIHGNQKSISDLWKMATKIRKRGISKVADLHNAIRSCIMDFNFRLHGINNIYKRKKDKKNRLALLNGKSKTYLITYHERFALVFEHLGFNVNWDLFNQLHPSSPLDKNNHETWIGIAPFSANQGKIYPLELMEEVVQYFTSKNNYKVLLFGGGKKEKDILEKWAKKYGNNCISLANKYDLYSEMGIMRNLDAMISMDSANMHLASIVGTPVLSIWGPSHPACGFRPWKADSNNFIQTNLSCRPCSEWGGKQCKRKDWACMYNISPTTIIQKTLYIIE